MPASGTPFDATRRAAGMLTGECTFECWDGWDDVRKRDGASVSLLLPLPPLLPPFLLLFLDAAFAVNFWLCLALILFGLWRLGDCEGLREGWKK